IIIPNDCSWCMMSTEHGTNLFHMHMPFAEQSWGEDQFMRVPHIHFFHGILVGIPAFHYRTKIGLIASGSNVGNTTMSFLDQMLQRASGSAIIVNTDTGTGCGNLFTHFFTQNDRALILSEQGCNTDMTFWLNREPDN